MSTNSFFKYSDKRSEVVAGMKLHQEWWSRPYEYAWALQYAEPMQVVADMGTGWMYRPFKNALSDICGHVYAVDADRRLLDQSTNDNMTLMVADFANYVPIDDASLDRIFCISVLEDLGNLAGSALREFKRMLKPDGLMVLTFDSQYDMNKPLGQYPGVNLPKFFEQMERNDLIPDGEVETDKTNAVYHDGFNLCCFHMVVKHADS